MAKQNRCWKGYEPTPGKKPGEKGSCKPKSFKEFFEKEWSALQEHKTAAWSRKEGKNKEGGLNKKGVESYRKENPDSKLQTAVTKDPSEIKKGSKDDKRRKSFCARAKGQDGPMKDEDGEPTRKALALKKWNC